MKDDTGFIKAMRIVEYLLEGRELPHDVHIIAEEIGETESETRYLLDTIGSIAVSFEQNGERLWQFNPESQTARRMKQIYDTIFKDSLKEMEGAE